MRIAGHRQRLTTAHVERMQIPSRFWKVRYDEIPESFRGEVDNYLKRLDDMLDRGDGLLFWGDNGTGKTSAAVFIALEVRRRCATVLFITAESLRHGILERQMFDEDMTVYERATTVDFLVVDDLGKEHPDQPGWSARLYENLFRVRSAAKRATIVTTNMEIPDLTKEYEASMMEVMKETMYPIFAQGENRRNEARKALQERLAG